MATSALSQLRLHALFLGVHGVDAVAGFTTPTVMEAETDRGFVADARNVVVLADHTKWRTFGISVIAALEEAGELISDEGLGGEARRILHDRVGRLRLAVTTPAVDSASRDEAFSGTFAGDSSGFAGWCEPPGADVPVIPEAGAGHNGVGACATGPV